MPSLKCLVFNQVQPKRELGYQPKSILASSFASKAEFRLRDSVVEEVKIFPLESAKILCLLKRNKKVHKYVSKSRNYCQNFISKQGATGGLTVNTHNQRDICAIFQQARKVHVSFACVLLSVAYSRCTVDFWRQFLFRWKTLNVQDV